MGVERKLATVLFVDLVDSTGLVSTTDPEIVRRRVDRFFEQASECIERHGGLVEKFAGDAVMAAFGVPQAHEDDAERAIRAALAILEATADLGLEARVGVEAGEVVVGDGDSTFATGEAINLAARLQQSAAPNQILIGPNAYRLTLDRIEVEDFGPVQVRGRDEPIWAWRAVAAYDRGTRISSLQAPLVGRDIELSMLENTYTRVVRDRRAHLVTIFGEPGVGKSRLAREFLDTLEGATVLQGRCLPYGEGITYWPLAEMVKVSAGIHDDEPVREAFDKLRACCEDEAIADLLANASGVLEAVEAEATGQEIAWAAREWGAKLAEPQPLVLVFEDIHWAEEPLLELIEHLAEYVRDAPLIILALARPELLEVRPSWGGGRLRSAAIELEPLADDEAEQLIDALMAGTTLEQTCRAEILDVTEGNPLFVEETIRMLAESDGTLSIATGMPNTLQALIAARIDRLPAAEKRLIQRAALIGRIFWEGALTHLSPELDEIAPQLESLVLRELVLPESRSSISGERAYKFKHVLIREVAYGGLSKSARAAQHARFAAWLKERAGEELLEIRAFHLDRAAYLLAELDGATPADLARRGCRGARGSGSPRDGARVVRDRAEALPALGRARAERPAALARGTRGAAARRHARGRRGDGEGARARGRAGEQEARGDRARGARRGRALHAGRPAAREGARDAGAGDAAGRRTDRREDRGTQRPRLDRELDRRPRDGREVPPPCAGRRARRGAEGSRGQRDPGSRVALHHEARPRCGETVARARDGARGGEWRRPRQGSGARALRQPEHDRGEPRRGRGLASREALDLYREVGFESGIAWGLKHLGTLAWKRGDLEQAQERYREAVKILKKLGDRAYLCEAQRSLAELLVDDGRIDEAERFALEARETVGPARRALADHDDVRARRRARSAGTRRGRRGALPLCARARGGRPVPADRARGGRPLRALPARAWA